jgi:hypothetical protein
MIVEMTEPRNDEKMSVNEKKSLVIYCSLSLNWVVLAVV